jgi:hypothetical protein
MVAAAAATTASPSVLQNETTEATYYRNSTIPIQVGGVLWSVFNRILISEYRMGT